MATSTSRSANSRELTFTERARRSQLIDVTIGLVAEHGYPQVSLAKIADGAGITKAAVLYHFPSKDALVQASYERVLEELTSDVGLVVEAASAEDAPAAYAVSMIRHLREHPSHARMIIEALWHGEDREEHAEPRWLPLANLIDLAVAAKGTAPVQSQPVALIVGGAIDAIVAEQVRDAHFDSSAAADVLATTIDQVLLGGGATSR